MSRLCLWTIKVASGWRDFGLKIRGPPARELAAASDEMFAGLISGTTVFPPAQSGLAEDRHIRRGRDSSRQPGPEQYDQTGLEPRPQTRTAGCDYLRLLFAARPHPAPNGAAGPARAQSPIDPAGQVRRVPLSSGCAAQSFYHRPLRAGVETDRIKARLARWVLAHLDPYIAKQNFLTWDKS